MDFGEGIKEENFKATEFNASFTPTFIVMGRNKFSAAFSMLLELSALDSCGLLGGITKFVPSIASTCGNLLIAIQRGAENGWQKSYRGVWLRRGRNIRLQCREPNDVIRGGALPLHPAPHWNAGRA